MKTFSSALGIAVSAVVVSCSPVGPDYQKAPDLDHDHEFEGGTLSQAAPVIDNWWRQLGDQRLNRLVGSVLKGNPDLRLSRQRLREARALRRQASAALLPQAHGSLSFTRLDFGQGGGGLTGEITDSGFITDPLDYWNSGMDVSWEIDVFGGKRREAEAAEARAGAARESLHATRLAIVSETVEAYFTLVGLKEQLARVHAQIASQEAQQSDVRDRQAVGDASDLDLDRARARLETTRALAPVLRAGIQSQERRVLVLLGTPRRENISTRSELPTTLPLVRTGLPADLVMRRPDIRLAERNLAAATADIGVATANFYPRFSLLGSPSASTRTFGDLFDAISYDWQVGPTVTWSLFSGGSNRAILEAANARQKQALTRYEKAVIAAIHEVEAELAALRSETQRLAIVQRAHQATARSVKRVREIRDAGAIDTIDVLIEEERLREVELAEIRIKSQLILIWTRLHKALGGGWR